MNITLCSKIPISEQIACQIEELINMNILKEDEKLPSVRELAIEINVNPNTVSKAFKLLEDKKIIYSLQKKAYFVSETQNKISVDKQNEIKKAINHIMNKFNLTYQELIDNIMELKGEK